MTTRDYLCVLTGLEIQLRRHANPWGELDGDESTQALREGWDSIAKHLKEEHPQVPIPIPFWAKRIFVTDSAVFPIFPTQRPKKLHQG